jgi:hypothetical protein
MESQIRCTCCNKLLKDKTVMLELSNTDGNYYKPEKFPKLHISQGSFYFGIGCAATLLKNQSLFSKFLKK